MKKLPYFSLILVVLIIVLALWIKHNEMKPGIPWKLVMSPWDGMIGPVKQTTTVYTVPGTVPKGDWTDVRTYDRNGRPLDITYYIPGQKLPNESVLIYTKDGRLKYDDYYYEKHRLMSRKTYSYSSTRHLGESGGFFTHSDESRLFWRASERYHRDKLTLYNASGQSIETTNYYTNEQMPPTETRVLFVYDKNGHFKESTEYDSNMKRVTAKTTYRSDPNGNVLEFKVVTSGKLEMWKKYSYKFDSRGNWTEQKEFRFDPTTKKLRDTVTSRRTIVYY
jgi:hypothetical protein